MGIAEALLVKESLDGKQINLILKGEQVVTQEEIDAFYEAQKEDESKSLKEAADEKIAGKKAESSDDVSSAGPSLNAVPQGT